MNIDKDLIGKPPNQAIVINDKLINKAECDTREKLEADVRQYANPNGYKNTLGACWEKKMLSFLDRQAAITCADVFEDGKYDCMTCGAKHELQQRVDSLTAECDSLRAKSSKQRKQLGELQDAIRMRNEGELKRQWKQQIEELTAERELYRDNMLFQAGRVADVTVERDRLADERYRYKLQCERWESKIAELTAEHDDLRSRLKAQADSFAKLERDNARLRDKLERVREMAGGDA